MYWTFFWNIYYHISSLLNIYHYIISFCEYRQLSQWFCRIYTNVLAVFLNMYSKRLAQHLRTLRSKRLNHAISILQYLETPD